MKLKQLLAAVAALALAALTGGVELRHVVLEPTGGRFYVPAPVEVPEADLVFSEEVDISEYTEGK